MQNLIKNQPSKAVRMPPFLGNAIKLPVVSVLFKTLCISPNQAADYVGVTEAAASVWFTGKGKPEPHKQILLHWFANNRLEASKQFYDGVGAGETIQDWAKRNRIKLEANWHERVSKGIKSTEQLLSQHAKEVGALSAQDIAKALQKAIELGHLETPERIAAAQEALKGNKAHQLQTLKELMLQEFIEGQKKPVLQFVGETKEPSGVKGMMFKVNRHRPLSNLSSNKPKEKK